MLNRDFKEFVESLNKHKVRFLIVGGYSLAYHGHPRYTKDLDIWVLTSAENASRIVLALNDFGFDSLGIGVEDFLEPGYVIQLGQPPARIDLLTSLTGLQFEECWSRRQLLRLNGLELPIISLEDLVANKRALGRNQDLADLEQLIGSRPNAEE